MKLANFGISEDCKIKHLKILQRSFESPLRVLVTIKDSSKKRASLLLTCRGGLGEAPYNHSTTASLQRCRLEALSDLNSWIRVDLQLYASLKGPRLCRQCLCHRIIQNATQSVDRLNTFAFWYDVS